MTNSLVIKDIRTNLNEIEREIRHLDVPAKQVLIEARIVTIDTAYEEQLGVRWGISSKRGVSGTLNAANQIRQGVSLPNINPFTQRLNFNNPANSLPVSGGNPASVGMALARIGNIFLDLELSALEAEGHGQIISSPHVITSNQQKATIQTGEEIPYQESTSSGATSVEFKNAMLSLEITPQITPNNKIILKIKANEDTRGQQLAVSSGASATGTVSQPVLGPPIINSHSVESNVLLNNNETIVIGGIYQQTKTNTVTRIPFLGSLPLVGPLFSQTGIENDRRELLIFVTPKIINPFAPNVQKCEMKFAQYKS